MPEPEVSLLEGMLLGERGGLSKELLQMFIIVGLIHIVVLSGSNIAIVAEGIFRLLGAVPRLPRARGGLAPRRGPGRRGRVPVAHRQVRDRRSRARALRGSPVVRVALDCDRATILVGDSADLGQVLPPNSIDSSPMPCPVSTVPTARANRPHTHVVWMC